MIRYQNCTAVNQKLCIRCYVLDTARINDFGWVLTQSLTLSFIRAKSMNGLQHPRQLKTTADPREEARIPTLKRNHLLREYTSIVVIALKALLSRDKKVSEGKPQEISTHLH